MTHLIQIRIAALSAFLVFSAAQAVHVDAAIAIVLAPQQVGTGVGTDANREGYRVKVPLPIDGQASAAVRQTLKRISEKTSPAAQRRNRPVVILEFDTRGGADWSWERTGGVHGFSTLPKRSRFKSSANRCLYSSTP
ncbi:hypothetical protein N9B22_01685 [bacterium]|nr:hypothetical protein [bacterium]